MTQFPRAQIGRLSVSRMMIGTNWFLGYSHTSKAKDRHILEIMTADRIGDILTAFMEAGVDTLYGMRSDPPLVEGIKVAEQRTGRPCIRLAIPSFPVTETPESRDKTERILDEMMALGVSICMPHQETTDAFVDRKTQSLTGIEPILAKIRERGMSPGLSTHMPETIGYADAGGLDVDTYIQIYNAAGFLMQVEVDWVQRVIWNAKKPVITIKPLAAGKVMPLVGLAFSWNTIRAQDMVCVGTSSPDEAREVVELSHALFERRLPEITMQASRSKASLRPVAAD